jgi:uncharacterized membrane protein YdfJ with MMPL/SSD domain
MIAHRVVVLVGMVVTVVALVLQAAELVGQGRPLVVAKVDAPQQVAQEHQLAQAAHPRENPSHHNLEITVKFGIHHFLDTFV